MDTLPRALVQRQDEVIKHMLLSSIVGRTMPVIPSSFCLNSSSKLVECPNSLASTSSERRDKTFRSAVESLGVLTIHGILLAARAQISALLR